jgi:cell division protein FtsW
MTMFMLGGASFRHLGLMVAAGVIAVVVLAQVAPYRAARLTTFLHPSLDPQGTGYHVNQAMLAIGAGGIWGRGLGQSVQKYNYLPEAQGDSVFAVMAEEFGFLLTLGFLVLWAALIARAWRIAATAADRFSQLVAGGIVAWFAWQSVFNIGGMLRLVPLTGLPLPFMSYGGTAMAVNLFVVGVLLSISRNCRAEQRPRARLVH